MTIRVTRCLGRAALLPTVLLGLASCQTASKTPSLDPELVAGTNRGVALMGRFDYEGARQEFERMVVLEPEDPEVQVNLAVAILNRQEEGDEKRALEILEGVLEQEPGHLRALYCAGLLELHTGETEKALARFQQITAADPNDADAAYFMGQSLMQVSRFDEALSWFQKAIEGDPFLRSAYYRAFQAMQRMGAQDRADEMKELLATFEALKDDPRARLVEFKYTKMGRKADVVTLGTGETRPSAPPPSGPIFGEARALPGVEDPAIWRAQAPTSEVSFSSTVADVDGNGRLDLFLTGALQGGGNALLMAEGDASGYELDAHHPLSTVSDVNAALWGDVDNDGLADVYLCRRGPNQLWRQTGEGSWEETSQESGTAGDNLNTVDGALFDADHDGDLDIFLVNSDGPNELLNNDRDGGFRPLGRERGLVGNPEADSRSVLVADLDGDRDADIVVLNRQPPHQVLLNGLLWEYTPGEGFEALIASEIVAALAGDADADGRPEIYTVDATGALSRWEAEPGGSWQGRSLLAGGQAGPSGLAFADVTGDGAPEIVIAGSSGWQAVSPDDGSIVESGAHGGDTWTVAVLSPETGPSLVAWKHGAPPIELAPGPGRQNFAAFLLSGQEDKAASLRSNASGIGTRVAVRVGPRWSVYQTFRQDSGPGQSLQPVAIGLGGATEADFVSLDWSDGVYQTEMQLAGGELHLLTETQRQLSSCPVLFAWDGDRYRFVSDFLGVGGMGYALGFGEYGEPRPWENLLLPEGLLRARDGRLVVKISEPMEEITYLDAVRLVAYDLPPGWGLALDERMGIAGPAPTGRPIFFRRSIRPVTASNERGEDVTSSILEADGQAAPVGKLDRRFIGRLEGEHSLTLRFEDRLEDGPGQPWLVADGWVEYPYSQTNFAAWQADAAYEAPSLDVKGADGKWQTLLAQFGYPAGMPRLMAVPLTDLPRGVTEIRLRTNQEVYWDRLSVVYEEECPEAQRHQLPLAQALLARTGFPLRSDGPQRYPSYDYSRRSPTWDVHLLAGHYTRLGPVDELVANRDDAVAIFGAGEEIHLEYQAVGGGVPEGWRRLFVLESNGWCKDMDLYTRDGNTVGPLPSAGLDPGPREHLHASYNTRYLSGRE